MSAKYLAKLFIGDLETLEKSGDNLEELHIWLLTQASGKLGDVHGEVVDSTTQEVVKQFRKCAPE